MHNHGTATFSGCYYVRSGYAEDAEGASPSERNATALLFAHPWQDSSEEWSDSALGRSGTLALWPGHLGHRVPPHLGNLERISIAFNVELTLGGEDEQHLASVHAGAGAQEAQSHRDTETQTEAERAQSGRAERPITGIASWDSAAVSEWLRPPTHHIWRG